MGKIFEEQHNINDQTAAGKFLAEKWKCEFNDCGKLSIIDFVITKNNKVKGVVEFKRRRNPINKYRTYDIAQRKIEDCLSIAKSLKTDFFLVVQWEDRFGWIKIESIDQYPSQMGGRYDRGPKVGQEMMMKIPPDHFHFMELENA